MTRSFESGVQAWPLARRLVRLGAIDRPDVEQYGVKIVKALAQAPPIVRREWTQTPQEPAEAF